MDDNLKNLLMDIANSANEGVSNEDVETPAVEEGVNDETTSGVETPDVSSGDEEQDTESSVDAQGAEEDSEGEPANGTVDGDEEEEEDTLFELDEEEETPTESTPEYFAEIQEVVGREIKSKEELKEFVDGLQSEITTLKEKASDNPLENIPEQLKEAVEYAKDGNGDYLELLNITSVDYTKLDPATLAENDIRQYFYDSEGNFDEDGFISYIDNVPEKELEIRGKQRISQLVAAQDEAKRNFVAKQEQRKEAENMAIEKAVNRLDAVSKFKVKASDKQKLIATLTNGGYKNVLLPRSAEGVVDFERLAQDVFIRQNFDKMVKVLGTRARNEFKKETIKNIGNQTVGASADVSAHTPDVKGGDPLDMMIDAARKNSEANSIYPNMNN